MVSRSNNRERTNIFLTKSTEFKLLQSRNDFFLNLKSVVSGAERQYTAIVLLSQVYPLFILLSLRDSPSINEDSNTYFPGIRIRGINTIVIKQLTASVA